MTSRQVLGGDKDWLSALGADDGRYGTSSNDERIPNYQAPVPQVVVDGGDVNDRLNAIFGLTPKNIGTVQAQPTQIDSLAAAASSDRRFYASMESGASNGYSAAAWHIGGLLNEVGYDLAKTARGAFQLVTDSNTQAAAYNALKFAVNNPGVIANNAVQGFKDFANKPFAEQADSVFKFGAGGLATAGAGKAGVLAVDGAITGATATAKWLAPKAGELLENYMYRSGSLAYAVPPASTSGVGDLGFASEKYVASVASDGRRVYKNLVDIDPGLPTLVDNSVNKSIRQKISDGWTNLDLMESGYAPIGSDGKQMNLHHILGQESGPMVELQASTHQQFSSQLHGLIEDGRSFRNDPMLNKQYNDFRREWWKSRATDFHGE